jgi:endonuclease IV
MEQDKTAMKYGIKLWTKNHGLYKEAVKLIKGGKADYIELTFFPGEKRNIELLREIPVVIHSLTYTQGVCYSDSNFEKNFRVMNETLKIADYLNVDKVIIHPDVGSKINFIKFLKKYNDKRIVIENMPKKSLIGKPCLGFSPEQISEFQSIGSFGFCLDLGHAIKASLSENMNYKTYISSFLKLNPTIMHLCDGNLNVEEDEHLNLGEGHYDLEFIKKTISKNPNTQLTLEVPKINGLGNDIKNIEFFKKINIFGLKAEVFPKNHDAQIETST